MVDFFIHRPVFSTVCALLIILAGAACIPTLPIAQFPNLAPPQVGVTAVYTGASSQTVESAVTTPLEQQINGAEGMKYITSSSGNDGVSTVTATFDITRDPDLATVDIENRVNTASGRLPAAVKQIGITVAKTSQNFVFGARRLFDPTVSLLHALHEQLPRCLRSRQPEACSRRRRCHHLRRAQILHAPVARSRAHGRPRPHRRRCGQRSHRAERRGRRRTSRFSARLRPARIFRSASASSAGCRNPRSSTTSS